MVETLFSEPSFSGTLWKLDGSAVADSSVVPGKGIGCRRAFCIGRPDELLAKTDCDGIVWPAFFTQFSSSSNCGRSRSLKTAEESPPCGLWGTVSKGDCSGLAVFTC